jgi:ATP-dependent helicase/nuclease subunit B
VRILAHIDPVELERELLSRVDGAHPRGRVARTLVLVPTNRLAEHVQRKLAEIRPAWLGVRVWPFRSLGREILEQVSGKTLHVASPLLLEALLVRLMRERPRNQWSAFVNRRPGAAGPLLQALRDLREAGIDPAEVQACAGDERTRDLGELYALFRTALDERISAGWTDDAGLARAALPHAPRFGEGLEAVFVHGAYELLGVYLDLLRELERTTNVTVLVPVAPGTRVSAYGERFAAAFLAGTDGDFETIRAPSDADRAARLSALYDEDGSPPSAEAGSFRFRNSQGPVAEVKFAVREALRAVRAGCAPTDIAITARSLEPYAAALEEAFDDAGLPWTSSLSSPLRRHPVVRDFLLLLRVLAEDFPRDGTVELLQSRHVDWQSVGCDTSPSAVCADRWSREAGIIDGLVAWTTELEVWLAVPPRRPGRSHAEFRRREDRAREDLEQARSIGEALNGLNAVLPREAATWSEHAARWTSVFERVFGHPGGGAADLLRETLDRMGEVELLVGDRRPVGFPEARAWLEDAVDGARLTLRRDDDGGIRVLDAMQLRGLTFRHVHVLGMNGDLFPRAPREDPVLPDAVRRALCERTGRPIGIKSAGTDEEHLLLALVLGSARERTEVSWQRAHESGRAKSPSLALREIARAAHGRPALGLVRDDAVHLPSHPRQWLDCLVERTGLLAHDEVMLLAALHSRAADAAGELGARFPDLVPGLEMLRATQAFEPGNGSFDGRIGLHERTKPLSVSEIEALGRCPLQFFFGSVLGVELLEDRSTAFELARNELGSRIHDLLEEIYATLRDEELFGGAPAEELVGRGLVLLEERRDRVFGDIGERLAERVPRLWRFEARTWFGAVRRFVEDDLRRIGAAGLKLVSLEHPVRASLDFDEGVVEPVRGRFDRLLTGSEGPVVGDYKTSTSLSGRVHQTSMLKGRTLQVPLYRMLAGPDAVVEVLGVHPDLDPADEEHRHRFEGFKNDACERTFRHTMRVLLRMRSDGIFPLNKGDQHCRWCDYRHACRRNHPPTLERESRMGDAEDYRAVQKKNTGNPDGR